MEEDFSLYLLGAENDVELVNGGPDVPVDELEEDGEVFEVPALCQQPGRSGDLSLVQINRNTALLLIDKDTAQGIQSPSLGYFLPFAVSLWH